jgi:hypothetical protein
MQTIKLRWFAEALIDLRTNPTIPLMAVFILGIGFFGTVINLFYDTIKSPSEMTTEAFVRITCFAIVLLVAAYTTWLIHRRTVKNRLAISEKSTVPPMKWLVTGLSPYQEFKDGQSNLDVVSSLIKYHHEALQEVFIVATLEQIDQHNVRLSNRDYKDGINVAKSYEKLDEWLGQQEFARPIISCLSIGNPNGAEDSFHAVTTMLKRNIAQGIIDPQDVIVDVTAGTKAMTTGLVSAALAYGCKLSYQGTKRNPDGTLDFSAGQRDTSLVLLNVELLRSTNVNLPD